MVDSDFQVASALGSLLRYFEEDASRKPVVLVVNGIERGVLERPQAIGSVGWKKIAVAAGVVGAGMIVSYALKNMGGSDPLMLPGDIDYGTGDFLSMTGDPDVPGGLTLVCCDHAGCEAKWVFGFNDAYPVGCADHPPNRLHRCTPP